jgi:hypothetical protein
MSLADVNRKYHPRSEAPATPLKSPKISYYSDHVTIRVPNGQWNEALQEQAQSANIRPDPRVVAELIASERSQPSTNQGAATPARPVLQSDSSDAIPLTHCNRTRRIIALAGFVVSSVTILGVHVAGNDGKVPGFQPLPLYDGDDYSLRSLFSTIGLGMFGFAAIAAVGIAGYTCHKLSEEE